MVSNNSNALLNIEPGAINQNTHPLGNVPVGTLCWVGSEEWCACIIPSNIPDVNPSRIMIGGDDNLQHFVLPLSNIETKGDGTKLVWCLVSGLGIVQMGINAHVRIIEEVSNAA